MTHSPHVGVFVFSTPEDIMANLQALQSQDAIKQWRQSIKEAFNLAAAKLPLNTKFVKRLGD